MDAEKLLKEKRQAIMALAGEFGGHNTINGVDLQIICIIPPRLSYQGIQHIIESKYVSTG